MTYTFLGAGAFGVFIMLVAVIVGQQLKIAGLLETIAIQDRDATQTPKGQL